MSRTNWCINIRYSVINKKTKSLHHLWRFRIPLLSSIMSLSELIFVAETHLSRPLMADKDSEMDTIRKINLDDSRYHLHERYYSWFIKNVVCVSSANSSTWLLRFYCHGSDVGQRPSSIAINQTAIIIHAKPQGSKKKIKRRSASRWKVRNEMFARLKDNKRTQISGWDQKDGDGSLDSNL